MKPVIESNQRIWPVLARLVLSSGARFHRAGTGLVQFNYMKPIEHFINGTIARPAHQCIFPTTKQVGSWLFTGDNHKDPAAIVSPLCEDFMGVIEWAKANHWEAITDTNGQLAYIHRPIAKSKGGAL